MSRVAAALLMVGALLVPAGGRAASTPPLTFSAPVMVAPALSEAWEPAVLTDRFGNIFVHARRSSTQLALAPDERSPTMTRSASWLWYSADGGSTFKNLPGLPLDPRNHEWGYEGDFAIDDANHLWFVDQTYADATITRWTVAGLGTFTYDFHRPVLPTAQPVDDRPWLAAHGNGNLFFMSQAGDPNLNQTGRDGGDAYGPGRYSIYKSSDAGTTWAPVGHALNESGGCRPAADHRPGSKLVVAFCTNDGGAQESPVAEPHGRGTLWAYVSTDDGENYTRYRAGDYNADAETFDWPLVTVDSKGVIWALHVDADKTDGTTILTNKLNLYRSSNQGRTWSRQNITPETGRYRWGSLAAGPNGALAFAIQHRKDAASPWRAYASVFKPGSKPVLSAMDSTPVDVAASPEPPSELMGLAFRKDGTIAVAWTRVEKNAQGLDFMRVYFAHSLLPAKKQPARR